MNGGAYEERTHQADKVGICQIQKLSRTSLSFTIFLKTEKKRGLCPCNKNQQDSLFTSDLFQLLTSTCFEQVYCSSSGVLLYIYNN